MELKQVIRSISYSNIASYINCPRNWKLKYVDHKFQSKQSLDGVYGTAIHETIQQFLRQQYYGKTLKYLKQNRDKLNGEYFGVFIKFFTNQIEKSKKKDLKFKPSNKDIEKYAQYGLKLLNQFLPIIKKYFPKKDMELYGIEFKVNYTPQFSDVPFKGFLDVVLHNKKTDKYIIIDLKTSMTGWKDKDKKNEAKRLQLTLYKYLFAKQMNIPLNDIDIFFLILKKRVYEKCQFKISRMQKFIPPNSERTVKKHISWVEDIVKQMHKVCQNEEKGQINPLATCTWCPFSKDKQLCDRREILKMKK